MGEPVNPDLLVIKNAKELPDNNDPKFLLSAKSDGTLVRTDYPALKSAIVSDSKGEATPTSSPTAWAPGDPYLFEKWDVKTAGTYTNFKDGSTPTPQPIVVTSADLQNSFIQIWVTNGVSQKVPKALPVVPVVDGFTSSSTTDASSAKNAKTLMDIITSNFVPKYSYTEFYDPATVLNGYYNASGVFTANTDWRATPKINVTAGEQWQYRGKPYTSLNIRGVYGYRANGTIVVLVDAINATNFVQFTIPSDVVQIAANYNVSTGTYFNLQKITTTQVLVSIAKDSVGNVTTINNENIYKVFTGLSICSTGDSLTANGVGGSLKGYQLWLQDRYNFTIYRTYGYSGRPLSTFLTPDGTSIIEQFINNAVSHDIFTLWAGTNDFKLNMRNGELGNMTDYKNLTSYRNSGGNIVSMNFYQALKAYVLRCYELNPKAKIIFITTTQRNTTDGSGTYNSWDPNPVGRTLSDFVNAMIDVAAYESLTVVNLFKSSGVNMRNLSQFTSDGLHLNNDGYKLASNLIAKGIDNVI